MLDKYEAMLRAGVEVYEYAGDPMLHSKFEVADDFWEHGSHNGDWRSRYGNNENLAYQHSKAGADAEDSHAQQLKQQSLQMTLDIVQARKHKIEEAIKAGVATAADKVVHL
jgi:phosphatidylserine/phosphatidylglycerophosphate/cardiolipin synthase-like enzyme